jgi:hypothetical protein
VFTHDVKPGVNVPAAWWSSSPCGTFVALPVSQKSVLKIRNVSEEVAAKVVPLLA